MGRTCAHTSAHICLNNICNFLSSCFHLKPCAKYTTLSFHMIGLEIMAKNLILKKGGVNMVWSESHCEQTKGQGGKTVPKESQVGPPRGTIFPLCPEDFSDYINHEDKL